MSLRVLLIYPPASKNEEGAGDLSGRRGDPIRVPIGLLTIAAHLRQHGFEADVINLCTFTWPQAVAAVRDRPADLFGLSSYTFNRHATAALGAEIKALFPESHVTCGGPHVSAMPLEWLRHYPAFDTVVIGEGEATALELATHLRDGRPTHGIAGAAWRRDGSATLGPPRPFIADLDSIGKPWKHFDHAFPVTSRGCPGRCTFCSTPRLWGRRIRFRSPESVLEEIEELVAARGRSVLRIKDDTFTAHRKRALAVCEGIVERGLEFRWSCDTRVDAVTPEVLAAMRRAGCVMVSYGIESASPEILRNIRKRTDLGQALEATAAARELGLDVRFYLMIGNRGETPATVRQTLRFIEEARPTHFMYYCLSIYPGTEEFEIARQHGVLALEDYFTDTTRAEFAANLGEHSRGMGQLIAQLGTKLRGERPYAPYTTAEREQILARHPDMLRSYTDLALSYCDERRFDEAERTLRRAVEWAGRETPALLHHLACIAFAKKDKAAAEDCFRRAHEAAPGDRHLRRDLAALAAAGSMSPREHAQMTRKLFATLRSLTPLGLRQPLLPMRLDPSPRPPSAWAPSSSAPPPRATRRARGTSRSKTAAVPMPLDP